MLALVEVAKADDTGVVAAGAHASCAVPVDRSLPTARPLAAGRETAHELRGSRDFVAALNTVPTSDDSAADSDSDASAELW